MSLSTDLSVPGSDLLDLIESVLIERDLPYDMPTDEEVVCEWVGSWCNYRMWFTWQEDAGVLLFSSAFDTRVTPNLHGRVRQLLSLANEKLWLGYFDLNSDDHYISFRYSLLKRGGNSINEETIREIMDIAFRECERLYPAVQSLVWGGKTPEEALHLAMFETLGEA